MDGAVGELGRGVCPFKIGVDIFGGDAGGLALGHLELVSEGQ